MILAAGLIELACDLVQNLARVTLGRADDVGQHKQVALPAWLFGEDQEAEAATVATCSH